MESWRKDARREPVIADLDALVPKDHLLRKIEKVRYKPWEYTYDPVKDEYICPQGESLRHTTTDRDGKRSYRSTPERCRNCPCKGKCGANEKGQKLLTTHIWQEYLDLVEALRKTERGKEIYAMRKETIERVFADAKEKHATEAWPRSLDGSGLNMLP